MKLSEYAPFIEAWNKAEVQGEFKSVPAVEVGNYHLSIQASQYHYCSPRATLENHEHYDTFEIALFDKVGAEREWILPQSDPRFKDFAWAEGFDPYHEGQTNSVAGYVSRETIETIIEDLLKMSQHEVKHGGENIPDNDSH